MADVQDLTGQISKLNVEINGLKNECEELGQMMEEKNSENDSLSLRCHECECLCVCVCVLTCVCVCVAWADDGGEELGK
jgi:hypothetical protein